MMIQTAKFPQPTTINPLELDQLSDQEVYNFVKTQIDLFEKQEEVLTDFFFDIDEFTAFKEIPSKIVIKIFNNRAKMIYYRKIVKDSIRL